MGISIGGGGEKEDLLTEEIRLVWEIQEDALRDVIGLIDLGISRTRAGKFSDPGLRTLVGGILEATRQELLHLGGVGGRLESSAERPESAPVAIPAESNIRQVEEIRGAAGRLHS